MCGDTLVASWFIQNPHQYPHLASLIEIPFVEKRVKSVWSFLHSIWSRYGSFPSREGALEILSTHPRLEGKDELREVCLETLREIYDHEEVSTATQEVVMARITDNLKAGLYDLLERSSYENLTDAIGEVKKTMERLASFMAGDRADWYEPLSEDNTRNASARMEEEMGPPIPSGLGSRVDEAFLNGGFRRAESLMLIGVTNDGKSACLTSFTADLARDDMRSLVFAMDSSRYEVGSKYLANFSGVRLEDDRIKSEFDAKLARNIRPTWRGRLAIRHWPRDSHTIDDVRRDTEAAIKHYTAIDEKEGLVPKEKWGITAVGIDHLGCLVPSAKNPRSDWEHIMNVASKADSLAKEFNVFVYSLIQAKIGAKYMDLVDMTQANRAWASNHPMTFVCGLCRNPMEKTNGKGRIYWDKTKRINCGYITPILFDKGLMRVCEDGDSYYPSEAEYTDESKPLRGKPVEKKPPAKLPPRQAGARIAKKVEATDEGSVLRKRGGTQGT